MLVLYSFHDGVKFGFWKHSLHYPPYKMGSLRGIFFLKNKRTICFFVLTIFRKTTVRFHFLWPTVMAHIFRICWVHSRSLAHSTFFYGHVFSICCVCSWMQGHGRISCASPRHGRSEENLGFRKAHSARWEGHWGAPCQSGVSFQRPQHSQPWCVGKWGVGLVPSPERWSGIIISVVMEIL